MYTILVASVNENAKLAKVIEQKLEALSEKSTMINLVELNLPMYSSIEEDKGIPKAVNEVAKVFEESEGVIVVAPEYNYSIPPVLTNAVAWVSRVDKDFKKYFRAKKILLATHSGGGGTDVLRDMRNQFTKLGAEVVESEVLTTYKKVLDEQELEKVLEAFCLR